MQHVHEARYYIARAEELGHSHLWTSYEPILEFLAHFRSAINAYAKCFVSAGPGRQRLESSVLFSPYADRLEKHERIIALRNKYVSHSDENECESVAVTKFESDDEVVLHLEYNLMFPFDRLYELRELIRFVELFIIDKQQPHVGAIEREVGKPVRILQGGKMPNPQSQPTPDGAAERNR